MDQRAMDQYCILLHEIKFRTETIDRVIKGEVALYSKVAEELCYLQLRMICEIIAVGCLIVHGTLSAKKSDLLKTYKADWIMSELHKLHQDFYPKPIAIGTDPSKWLDVKDGFLDRHELREIWQKHAGGRLHHENARSIIDGNDKKDLSFKMIAQWNRKIMTLLNKHTIVTPDGQQLCLFQMNKDLEKPTWTRFDLVSK